MRKSSLINKSSSLFAVPLLVAVSGYAQAPAIIPLPFPSSIRQPLAGSLPIINPNFSAVRIVCGGDYAYQAFGGNCNGPYVPQQDYNSEPGIGWKFITVGNPYISGGTGLTGPNTAFNPPSFSGLPFTQAAFIQDNGDSLSQTVGGFSPGAYNLSFYLGSRYSSGPDDGNQTIQALIDGTVIGTWKLTSFTPFTLRSSRFTCGRGGAKTLKFIGLAKGDHTAFLSGVAITPTTVAVSKTSLAFPLRTVGTTSHTQSVRMTNVGSTALDITGITLTAANSGDFAQQNDCGSSLPAGASCRIAVTFTPRAQGVREASLSIGDDAPDSPQTVALTGRGTFLGGLPSFMSFDNQPAGTTSAVQTTIVTNTGPTTMAISSIQIGGANPGDFAQTNTCGASLSPGASCAISVSFTPSRIGLRSGLVVIHDSLFDGQDTVSLSGNGT